MSILFSASDTVTRPADTNAYAVNDAIANSTTAASVIPLAFSVGDYGGGPFAIFRAEFKKSKTTLTNAQFRLHLYATDPSSLSSGITGGDNAAYATKHAGYLGSIDFDLTAGSGRTFSDAACIEKALAFNTEIPANIAPGAKIYGLLQALAAYAPDSAEVFTVTLWAKKNP